MEEMTHARRIIVPLIGGSLITCHLLGVLCKSPNLALKFRKALVQIYSTCFVQREESNNLFDDRVAKVRQTRQMQLAKAALRTSSWFHTIWCASMVFNVAIDAPRWMTYPQEAAFFLVYATTLALTNCPRLHSASSAKYWYAYFMFLSWSLALPIASKTQTHYAMSIMMLPQFMYGALCLGRTAAVFAFNIFMVAIVMFANTQETNPCLSSGLEFMAVGLCVNTAIVHLALHWVDVWIEAEARHEIETVLHSNENSAASSLLGRLCDVLVELNSEYRIERGAEKLSTMLLRSTSTSLRGELFQSLMNAEDSKRFMSEIKIPSLQEGEACHIMHVRMHDSFGNPMNIELFIVRLPTLAEASHYLVGAREFTDVPPMTIPGSAEATPAGIVAGGAASALEPMAGEVPTTRLPTRRRKQHRSKSSGTPADSAFEVLGGDAASESSVATGTSGLSSLQSCSLVHPNYMPTTSHGKVFVMMQALFSCNVPYTKFRCCMLHCLVEDARRTLNQLGQLPCQQTRLLGEWQCQHCGVIDSDARMQDGTCYLCGKPSCAPNMHTSL